MGMVVSGKTADRRTGVFDGVKRAGKSGWYFRVLNCASEYGLSSLTWGRLSLLVTPRLASKSATGLERIECRGRHAG